MPQLGETVAEGKITKWFKSAGDAVKPGDNLFEIETDKVSMEVPSITTGTLAEIKVQAGETALVGAVVAVIAGEGGAAENAPAAKAPPPASKPAPPQAPFAPAQAGAQGHGPGPRSRGDERNTDPASFAYANLDPFFEVRTPSRNFGPAKTVGGSFVTPLARRLAGENGIDLTRMSGSGPRGRIVAADVEAAIAKGGGRAPPMASGASAGAGQGALPGRRVRGGAARRHARNHRAPPGRGQADHPAFLSCRRRDDGCAPENPRGGQRRRAKRFIQALGQRFRHQGAGARLAARARRQRGVGRRPHPALQAFRCRCRGRDRRQACSRR